MASFQEMLDHIAPRGHTLIVLDKPITSADVAQQWRAYIEQVSDRVEQRGAVLIVPFSDIAQAEAFAAMPAVKSCWRMVAVCYHGALGQEPELGAGLAGVLSSQSDPAVPFNGLKLPGVVAPDPKYTLTRERVNRALNAGVTIVKTGADGVPEVVRVVTTYQVDSKGAPDDLLLDVNGPLVLDYVRVVMKRAAELEPRRKNTEQSRRELRSLFLAEAIKLEEAEILQNVNARANALTVVEDPNDRTAVKARIPADWVRGMHVINVDLDVY